MMRWLNDSEPSGISNSCCWIISTRSDLAFAQKTLNNYGLAILVSADLYSCLRFVGMYPQSYFIALKVPLIHAQVPLFPARARSRDLTNALSV